MFRIDKMTPGRFGNRILQYNTLLQLASHLKKPASCVLWEGHHYFSNLVEPALIHSRGRPICYDDILNNDLISFSGDYEYVVQKHCLHNVFWEVTHKDPRQFMKIRETFKVSPPPDKTSVGIHFRGTDLAAANHNHQLHHSSYYQSAIEAVESKYDNALYYVCTDDYSHLPFIECLNHLRERKLPFILGNKWDHYGDFSRLSACDILINSSSTFCICAGFLGKKDKRIIHSKEWVMKNVPGPQYSPIKDHTPLIKTFDNFWKGLYDGGNEYYRVWKFL